VGMTPFNLMSVADPRFGRLCRTATSAFLCALLLFRAAGRDKIRNNFLTV
jgi:hypothetical protein